jgi:hypothetical protein
MDRQRIFVFKTKSDSLHARPFLLAFPEDQITKIKSQCGSQNVYLEVNDCKVQGSFDELVEKLGERIDID